MMDEDFVLLSGTSLSHVDQAGELGVAVGHIIQLNNGMRWRYYIGLITFFPIKKDDIIASYYHISYLYKHILFI